MEILKSVSLLNIQTDSYGFDLKAESLDNVGIMHDIFTDKEVIKYLNSNRFGVLQTKIQLDPSIRHDQFSLLLFRFKHLFIYLMTYSNSYQDALHSMIHVLSSTYMKSVYYNYGLALLITDKRSNKF